MGPLLVQGTHQLKQCCHNLARAKYLTKTELSYPHVTLPAAAVIPQNKCYRFLAEVI